MIGSDQIWSQPGAWFPDPVFNRYWMNIKQRIQHLTWWMRVQTNGTRSSYSPIRSFDTSRAGHLTHHVMYHVTNHVTKIIQSDSTKEHIFSKCQMKITKNMINMIIKYIIIWIINKIKFLSKSNFVSDAFHIDENWRMINYLYKIVKKNS